MFGYFSSTVSKYVNYQPGDSWEAEMTIEKMLSLGKLSPDYESIVVKEPSKRKKSIVICIDRSMSVLQLIHQIVLMASVLSLSVKRDNFAIIDVTVRENGRIANPFTVFFNYGHTFGNEVQMLHLVGAPHLTGYTVPHGKLHGKHPG